MFIMKSGFTIIALALIATTTTLASGKAIKEEEELSPRIVGGGPVDIQDYPYQLSLRFNGNHVCGAVVISVKFALTAAHCVFNSEASDFSVRAGSSNRISGGQVVNVKAIHIHPQYDEITKDYDMAVLDLESPLILGTVVKPIDLPENENEEIPVASRAWISGWGALTEDNFDYPVLLQAVDVNVISQETCKSFHGLDAITERMMCAGYYNTPKDACQGDAGGPLVYNEKLIAIMSWGYGCARPNYPAVYTRIAPFRQYILSITGI